MCWKSSKTFPRFPPTSISTQHNWLRLKPEVEPLRVLGIDPGTAVMGYGVVESGAGRPYRLLECGTLTTGARDPLPSRLRVLHDGVTALIARHTPDAVAVESAFYGKNVRTTVVLSHARGVILLAAEMADVEIAEYSPAVIKKTVVGRGAAMKAQVGYMVAQLLRLKEPPTPGDAAGGVGYEITVPVGVAVRLPSRGTRVSLFTELVVKEDGWALYGFDSSAERQVFQRLLGASGFGPKLALALLSALGPERTVRSILARDLTALSSVSGIGRKKAERLVLELQDRFADVVVEPTGTRPLGSEDAVQALMGLGYGVAAADDAVRAALAAGAPAETPQLIRRALQQLAATRGA